MTVEIRWGAQDVRVSDRVMSQLLDFTEAVGRVTARDDEEKGFAEGLAMLKAAADFPGDVLDLDAAFPSMSEKKFWSRVFHDVARRIFLRRLGLHETTFWQCEMIAVAGSVGAWLTRAVQSEAPWYPETEDWREAADWRERHRQEPRPG